MKTLHFGIFDTIFGRQMTYQQKRVIWRDLCDIIKLNNLWNYSNNFIELFLE